MPPHVSVGVMLCFATIDFTLLLLLLLLYNNNNNNNNNTQTHPSKELGWVCVPMVVEAYGAWGTEAMESLALLASRLATSSNRAKDVVLAELYGRLNLCLVRANAVAILSRCFVPDQ